MDNSVTNKWCLNELKQFAFQSASLGTMANLLVEFGVQSTKKIVSNHWVTRAQSS